MELKRQGIAIRVTVAGTCKTGENRDNGEVSKPGTKLIGSNGRPPKMALTRKT